MSEANGTEAVDIGTEKTLKLDGLSRQLRDQHYTFYTQGNIDSFDPAITVQAERWLSQDKDFLKESLVKHGDYSAMRFLTDALALSSIAETYIKGPDGKKIIFEDYQQIESLGIKASFFIAENLVQIGKRVESDVDSLTKATMLGTIASSIKYLPEDQGNRCIEFILKNFMPALSESQAIKPLSKGVAIIELRHVLAEVFRYGRDTQRDSMRELMMRIFQEGDPRAKEFVQNSTVSLILMGISSVRYEIAPDILRQYKLSDYKDETNPIIMDDWAHTAGFEEGESDQAIAWNLERVFVLEHRRPGITAELHKRFGISIFARYPIEILIAQYDKRDERNDVPYGVIINGKLDRPESFYGNTGVWRELFKQLGQLRPNCGLRVLEVDSVSGLVGAINTTRHKYGKISFAILGGHGLKGSIEFGKGTNSRSNTLGSSPKIYNEFVRKKGARSLALAFVRNPTIILNSCSTGALGGIGQAISTLKTTLIAPTEDASIKDIGINAKGPRIGFKVHYVVIETNQDIPAQVYRDGKAI